MGDQPPYAGLGKLYFCRVEDKDKEPQPLGEVVSLEPGMLTYKDDDDKPSYSQKGFSITFTGTIEDPNLELMELMVKLLNRWDVRLEREPGRMPRKMKKALRARYRRDTKWKRKLASHLGRLCHTLHRAEIVITREQRDRLARHIEMTVRPETVDGERVR